MTTESSLTRIRFVALALFGLLAIACALAGNVAGMLAFGWAATAALWC